MPPKPNSKICVSLLIPAVLFLASGCSSVSLPSMPWSSGPAVQPDATAEALYQEGIGYLKNKSYLRAIDRLQRVKSEFPFSPQLADAELKLAEAYYLNKQSIPLMKTSPLSSITSASPTSTSLEASIGTKR